MRRSFVTVVLCGIGAIHQATSMQLAPLVLEKSTAAPRTVVAVPWIGCKSDGQAGPREAPKGEIAPVLISGEAAEVLAYYRSSERVGVLAPRGWHCLGVYGSGGEAILVSPDPIERSLSLGGWHGFTGPAIVVSRRNGDTSGRFDVAEVIARVFPAYRAFVQKVASLFFEPMASFPAGPYPADILTYKGNNVVEYTTRANSEGLGTRSWLRKNGNPIDGVAILVGETPDLLLLSVRLSGDSTGLVRAIVSQVEEEASHRPRD